MISGSGKKLREILAWSIYLVTPSRHPPGAASATPGCIQAFHAVCLAIWITGINMELDYG
jgi:hypothetical protein